MAAYRVQLRVGSGPWRVVTPFSTARSLILPGISRRSVYTLAGKGQDKPGNWATSYVVAQSAP